MLLKQLVACKFSFFSDLAVENFICVEYFFPEDEQKLNCTKLELKQNSKYYLCAKVKYAISLGWENLKLDVQNLNL